MSFHSTRTITTKQTIYYGHENSSQPQTVIRETTYSQRGDGALGDSQSPLRHSLPHPTPSPAGQIQPGSTQQQFSSGPSTRIGSGPVQAKHANVVNSRRYTPKEKSYDEVQNECKSSGNLWEDPDFPAVTSSVYSRQPMSRRFEWKRPHVYNFIFFVVVFHLFLFLFRNCVQTPSSSAMEQVDLMCFKENSVN